MIDRMRQEIKNENLQLTFMVILSHKNDKLHLFWLVFGVSFRLIEFQVICLKCIWICGINASTFSIIIIIISSSRQTKKLARDTKRDNVTNHSKLQSELISRIHKLGVEVAVKPVRLYKKLKRKNIP